MESFKFLNILNAMFWRSLKDLKSTYLIEIYLYAPRKSNVTTRVTIIDDYLLTYIS